MHAPLSISQTSATSFCKSFVKKSRELVSIRMECFGWMANQQEGGGVEGRREARRDMLPICSCDCD